MSILGLRKVPPRSSPGSFLEPPRTIPGPSSTDLQGPPSQVPSRSFQEIPSGGCCAVPMGSHWRKADVSNMLFLLGVREWIWAEGRKSDERVGVRVGGHVSVNVCDGAARKGSWGHGADVISAGKR